jgi:hypothetical protein
MQKKRLKLHLETVRAIAASKSVRTFYIGMTSRDPFRYWAWYRRNEYPHAVILADWLTEEEAKFLEEHLQQCCYKADRRTPLWKKAPGHQNGRYIRGAKSPKPNQRIHSVYISWRENK